MPRPPFKRSQYALESLADTGLPRHFRFIETARRYETEYRAFVQTADAADPDSYHLLGLAEGMSHKSVAPESVPVFKEDLSAATTITNSLPDLLVLTLFALVAFMAAHLAFAKLNLA